MTIGRNSRQGSVRSSMRAPKFLDKSSGFYGRLDKPETKSKEKMWNMEVENGVESSLSLTVRPNSGADEDVEVLDFTDGLMEDDGETLLHRKPSRRSSRWRRSSRRKQKEAGEEQARNERPSPSTQSPEDTQVLEDKVKELKKMEEEKEKVNIMKEPALIHFQIQEYADDRVLIRDKKRGREEETEEERTIKKDQEEGMKVVKRNTVKNYRKAFDRAFRRGWEAFITNLYSVTLTPATPSSPSSSSPSLKKKHQHNSVLAEIH